MSKRRMPRKNRGHRLKAVMNSAQLTGEALDEGLIDLEKSGLIKFVTMPDGEVRLLTPRAPAPACNGFLIWEG